MLRQLKRAADGGLTLQVQADSPTKAAGVNCEWVERSVRFTASV
jgi:hypothetical protein